jgi:hypothetical protein
VCLFIHISYRIYLGGRNCVDVIATLDGLVGPRIKSRWGARLSMPDQTGLGANVVFCEMGAMTLLRVKRPESGADHTPVSSYDTPKGFTSYLRLSSVPE